MTLTSTARRDIILIDELVESGRTFAATADKMRRMGAKSVKTLCLVDKPSCHKVALEIDYWALQASLGRQGHFHCRPVDFV